MMEASLNQLLENNKAFQKEHAELMKTLAEKGQSPKAMVIACSDSRVDPALLLQAKPGDLFIVRNVANIVPPYKDNEAVSETAAALDFGIKHLKIKHLIIIGHSDCGGIKGYLSPDSLDTSPLIKNWVSELGPNKEEGQSPNSCAKSSLLKSKEHCLSYPWIKEKVDNQSLSLHLWFTDIGKAEISVVQ